MCWHLCQMSTWFLNGIHFIDFQDTLSWFEVADWWHEPLTWYNIFSATFAGFCNVCIFVYRMQDALRADCMFSVSVYGQAWLRCHPQVSSVCFQGNVQLLNCITLSQLSVHWTGPRDQGWLLVSIYVCVCVRVRACVGVCTCVKREEISANRFAVFSGSNVQRRLSGHQWCNSGTLTQTHAHQTSQFHLPSPWGETKSSCNIDGPVL